MKNEKRIIEKRNILFFLSIVMLFFAMTFRSAPTEFSDTDIIFIFLAILAICMLQIFLSSLFRINIAIFLQSIFLLINIFSLNLILNNDFIGSSLLLIGAYCVVVIFILNALLKMVHEYAKAGQLMAIGLFFLAAVIFVSSLLGYRYDFSVSEKSGVAGSENIQYVEFNAKPNVYLISFDALIPEIIFKKLFKSNESAKYHAELNKNFYAFKNYFANAVPTKNSLGSLLLLEQDLYLNMDVKFRHSVFNGIVPSPLFEVFKHNGYEVNTLFENGYFGRQKGPYVDNYFVDDKITGACKFIPEPKAIYAFFGYCAILKTKFIRNIQKIFGNAKLDPVEHLLKSMLEKSQSDAPQIFLAYMYTPGHTLLDHNSKSKNDLEKFREMYMQNSRKTAEYLKQIVGYLQKEDPDSILYVFGDHGAYLSRTLDFEDDIMFVVHDRFAVYGGVYPKDRCNEFLSLSEQRRYTTVIQGMDGIIQCLSGGRSVFVGDNSYKIRNHESGESEYSYDDYIYE